MQNYNPWTDNGVVWLLAVLAMPLFALLLWCVRAWLRWPWPARLTAFLPLAPLAITIAVYRHVSLISGKWFVPLSVGYFGWVIALLLQMRRDRSARNVAS
jgi:hypothetical protein